MALVKCPKCGRENVSSTAKSCPECGYNIKAYYEERSRKENDLSKEDNLKSDVTNNKYYVKSIIVLVIVCFGIFCIYYFATRCSYDDCTEKKMSNSQYCKYHSESQYYKPHEYKYVPKTGNAGAEARAESYLNSSAFSYTGLIHQLEYEGFSTAEATYGADNCGANWKEQALKKAKSYLNSSAFSYSGLQHQLEYEGFTDEEAQYGVDNCNADWNEQAAKKAKSYLRSSPDMGKSRLIDQLKYEGFSYEQAVYGVKQAGL